jgi:cell division protein FtsQ
MPDRDYIPGTDLSQPVRQQPARGNSDPSAGRKAGGWLLLFLVFILVLGALGGLAYFAGKWKKQVEVSRIVVDGASLMPEGDIVSALQGFRGSNMQELDIDRLRKKVLRFPYVSDAVLGKELNGVVRVRLFERVPVARTIVQGRATAIDREGFLLPENSRLKALYPRLPAVSGVTRLRSMPNGLQRIEGKEAGLIVDFYTALARTEYACLLVTELHLEDGNMSYCLTRHSPTRFIVGNDGNFKEKLKKFEIFWQKVVSKKGFDVYDVVDLRFRDRVFTRDAVSGEVPRQVSP